jgi:hypothetical protein
VLRADLVWRVERDKAAWVKAAPIHIDSKASQAVTAKTELWWNLGDARH